MHSSRVPREEKNLLLAHSLRALEGTEGSTGGSIKLRGGAGTHWLIRLGLPVLTPNPQLLSGQQQMESSVGCSAKMLHCFRIRWGPK